MPSLPQIKLSAQPVVTVLLPGDRVPVLRRAVDEADPTKRNPTTTLAALAAAVGAGGGPNNRPDLSKSYQFATRAAATASGYPQGAAGIATLDEANPTELCLTAEAKIAFYRDGTTGPFRPETLVLMYDAAGPLQVFYDGSFQRYYQISGSTGLSPARWFVKDSPAYVAALPLSAPEWSATFNAAGTPPGYPAGFTVRYTLSGTEGLYFARIAGQLAAPTNPGQDVNWQRTAAPVPAEAFSQNIPYELSEAEAAAGRLVRNRLYRILGGDLPTGRSVLVTAAAADRFSPVALRTVPPVGGAAETYEPGTYNVNTGVFTVRADLEAPFVLYTQGAAPRGFATAQAAIDAAPGGSSTAARSLLWLRQDVPTALSCDKPVDLFGPGITVAGLTMNSTFAPRTSATLNVAGSLLVDKGHQLDFTGNVTLFNGAPAQIAVLSYRGSSLRMRGDVVLSGADSTCEALVCGLNTFTALDFNGTVTVQDKGRAVRNQGGTMVLRGRIVSADAGMKTFNARTDIYATIDTRKVSGGLPALEVITNGAHDPATQKTTLHVGHALLAGSGIAALMNGNPASGATSIEVAGGFAGSAALAADVVLVPLTPAATPAFTPITANQYGTGHPAFTTQAAVNAYLLSGSTPAPAPTISNPTYTAA